MENLNLAKEDQLFQLFEDNCEAQFAYYILKDTKTPVFLTGKAGSGKSTFIKFAESLFSPVLKVAPTGIAALNINGDTVNSTFHLPPKLCLPTKEFIDSIRFNEPDGCLLAAAELLIVDEVSMVNAATLDCMDQILRAVCHNNQPFGGKRVLMVGDIFQLPPIVGPEDKQTLLRHYKSEYFFDSKVFQEMNPVKIELQKSYRQNDEKFLEILNNVRSASNLTAGLGYLNKSCLRSCEEDSLTKSSSIVLAFENKTADALNKFELSRLPSNSYIFKAIVKGRFNWFSVIAEETLEIKVGARVMLTKNHSEGLYVNGTLGYVNEISEKSVQVITDQGAIIEVTRETWTTLEYGPDKRAGKFQRGYQVVGSMKQFPFKLAWAITVHKSQGLTFDNVFVMNKRPSFAPGQTYVALSRCTSLEGLRLLAPLHASEIKVNNYVLKFAENLKNEQRVEAIIDEILASLE